MDSKDVLDIKWESILVFEAALAAFFAAGVLGPVLQDGSVSNTSESLDAH